MALRSLQPASQWAVCCVSAIALLFLGGCEAWIPRCTRVRARPEAWYHQGCTQVAERDYRSYSRHTGFSGSWYAYPQPTSIAHKIGTWHDSFNVWDAIEHSGDDDDDTEVALDTYMEFMVLDGNGYPEQHLAALGMVGSLAARIGAQLQRKSWGIIAWVYDDNVQDGSAAHLCRNWSEICHTPTSFEWQYQAVYDYSDAMFREEGGEDCGRVRVIAHERFELDGTVLRVDSRARGVCIHSGTAVTLQTQGVLQQEKLEFSMESSSDAL